MSKGDTEPDGDTVPQFGSKDYVDYLVESSPDANTAFDRLDRFMGFVEDFGELVGVPTPGITHERRIWSSLASRYERFHRLLAPRGWALSDALTIMKGDLFAVTALEHGAPAEAVDDALAETLIASPGVDRLLTRMSAPLKAIWRWAPLAGDAASVMLERRAGPAAFAWLVIAEGMWKDLQPTVGRERPRHFFSHRAEAEQLTEGLTWKRESLVAAREVLIREVNDPYLEPLERAPTNRHALLHGNVSGILKLHHAAKAFTLVDALVDEALLVLKEVDAEFIQLPPWK